MIVATLLVKDEEEILEEWFEHHISQGIDKFIVTNNDSKDKTKKIIDKFSKKIELIIEEPKFGHYQDLWVTRMAHIAANLKPDWIVHIDADEFWSGFENLKDIPKNITLVMSNNWFNHFPHFEIEKGQFNRSLMPYFSNESGCCSNEKILEFHEHFATSRKIIHRPSKNILICPGNHRAINFEGDIIIHKKINIHHYPIRYFDQFKNKVIRGGEAMKVSGYPEYVNHHWRRWYKEYESGDLKKIYEKIIYESKGNFIL